MEARELHPRDLRFGNWVNGPDGHERVVDILCDSLNTDKGNRMYSDIQDIELTDIILRQSGFDNEYSGYGVTEYSINGFVIITLHDGEFHFLKDFKPIKTVRELQNLYFALTGTELEIKL